MPAKAPKKPTVASANWLALQKELKPATDDQPPRKKRKIRQTSEPASVASVESSTSPQRTNVAQSASSASGSDSIQRLKKMVFGEMDWSESQRQPGKYLALDCEMVGVGIEGEESSLARVSLVNFYGAVILDEFVRQRERVVDYRTQWSGIRESDMVNAKPFEEVQKQVADLLKDRILVGHAVYNDLKALLLSHPRPMTRDTQYYAGKFEVVKTNRIALRHLVKQELGITIQQGEHSSVTDARATMAVFRLHRKTWEKDMKPLPRTQKKRKHSTTDEEEAEDGQDVKGGRKGISSGLSTVIRRDGDGKKKTSWWKDLGGGVGSPDGSKGSKGILRLS